MKNKLELAWETFEFYNTEVYRCESLHSINLNKFYEFVESLLDSDFLGLEEKGKFLSKINKSSNSLLFSYNKQLEAVDNLISLNDGKLKIPAEREISLESLQELKSLTLELISELKQSKADFNDFLS